MRGSDVDFCLSEDQQLFQRTVREFATREIAPVARAFDEAETFPRENVQKMAALGLMGLTVPEEYGGAGAGAIEYVIAMEEISRACAAHSVILTVNVSLVCDPILKYGTEAQRRRYLPALASGAGLGAFALSEPTSGSDAAHMQTRARCDGDAYVINGAKNFITNGGEASVYLLFAATDPERGAKGVTAFLIDADTPGFRPGAKEAKLGIRASTTTQVFFDECRVSASQVLGEPGQGFRIAMSTLDSGRIGIAAQAVGIGQAALDAALGYASQRRAFGQPISEFQAIQWMLADMHLRVDQARLLTYRAATLKQAGKPFSSEAAMAKLAASEAASFAADRAIQVHGGYGYMRDYPVEKLFRDARITEIYEGTSEIQRLVIARGLLRGVAPTGQPA